MTALDLGPLLQRRIDVAKLGIQGAAETVDRNARCDQSVFNRGSAGFVRLKHCKNALQLTPPDVVHNLQAEDRLQGLRLGKFEFQIS